MQKGFKDVNILFDGMDGWLDYATNTPDKPAVKWTRSINYDLLPADEFNKMIVGKKDFALIDVRTKDEFANTSKNYWQNIGQVKNSVNIPFAELKTSVSLPASKALPVIVYGFNSQPEIFEWHYKQALLGCPMWANQLYLMQLATTQRHKPVTIVFVPSNRMWV